MMMMMMMIITVNPQTTRISPVKITNNHFLIGAYLVCRFAVVLRYFRSDDGQCLLQTVSVHPGIHHKWMTSMMQSHSLREQVTVVSLSENLGQLV